MRRTAWVFMAAALAVLVLLMLSSCAPAEKSTSQQATDQVQQQTEQTQQNVDEILNKAQQTVGDLAAAVGGLEARINGLQISSDLQEVQRKLNNAVEEVGDKKIAAIQEVSTALDSIIYRVDNAAAKLPEGGKLKTELDDFSAKLKDTRTKLGEAVASGEASSTTSP